MSKEKKVDRRIKWAAEKVERVPYDLRKDATFNKDVLKKAAEACNETMSEFLTVAALERIENKLGADWLGQNGNHPQGEE